MSKQHAVRPQVSPRREEQDLANGAVLQAEVDVGNGDRTPKEGDLVFVHVAISNADGTEQLWSSRAEQGGTGQPLAVILGKGARAPRAWEIALAGMREGGRVALKVRPSYGFHHPTCKLPAPPGVKTHQTLGFDLQLVSITPAENVRVCGLDQSLLKRVLHEGESFETARPPFEVSLHIAMRTLAYNAVPESGNLLYTTMNASGKSTSDDTATSDQPLKLTLGEGSLPPGVEDAVSHMCKGERSLFIIPCELMQPPSQQATCPLPAPPAKALQVEVMLHLLSITQVRDMTGTGEVTKRRVREGKGEFPIDCPLHDTSVLLHYRVRAVRGGVQGPWLYDTRSRSVQHPQSPSGGAAQPVADVPPLEIDTGCGEAPEAVEMCVKLMIPNELALVTAKTPKYAYEGRSDAPDGLQGAEEVQWEVELVSFEKEGHWQVMSMAERFEVCERVKGKANALVKASKHSFAKARYQRLLRLMESTRDYSSQEDVEKMDAYKLAVLLNLALCDVALNEPASAISWCDKALECDAQNAKAFFRRGVALSLKGDHDEAEPDLRRAAEINPDLAVDVDKELAANQRRAKAAAAKQKSQFKNFFGRT